MKYLPAIIISFLLLTGFLHGPSNMSMRMSTGGSGGELTYQDLRDNTSTLLRDNTSTQLRSW
jgi:hypothetical protein